MTPDQAVCARDRAVPGLAAVLDGDAFAELLRERLPDRAVDGSRPVYVRYKPGTSCLVLHEVASEGGVFHVYARAHARGQLAKAAKVRKRATARGALGEDGLLVASMLVAVYPFPNDRRLPGLTELADCERRRPMLERLLPAHPRLVAAPMRTLSYKPERRLVSMLEAPSGERAVLRAYAGGFDRAAAAARELCSEGPLRVPRLLRGCADQRLLALEWLPGAPLGQACFEQRAGAAETALAGAALAALHRQDVPRLEPLGGGERAGAVLAAARFAEAVCPELDGRAVELAARAAELAGQAPAACAVHGDFSPDQVLLDDRGVAVLDLDEARRGDPVADLASYAAALELDCLRERLPAERAWALATALREGYASEAGALSGRMTTRSGTAVAAAPLGGSALAAALLRLAPEPFRRRDPDWPRLTHALVERAGELLGRG